MSLLLSEFALSATPPPFAPTLISSALTPTQFESIFQPLISNILGIPANPSPWGSQGTPAAWKAVRIGWQQQGQPAWAITDDVCILMATTEDDPFSQSRDGLLTQDTEESLNQEMSYTQVWNLAMTVYGPNSANNARQIVSSMALDWVHDTLAAKNIYAIARWNRPQYVPELKDGQWWQRTDVKLQFNELVNESTSVLAAASAEVTLITNTGISESFEIQA